MKIILTLLITLICSLSAFADKGDKFIIPNENGRLGYMETLEENETIIVYRIIWRDDNFKINDFIVGLNLETGASFVRKTEML